MVVFLSVPLKTTNEVDLIKPLKAYVESLQELSTELKLETNEGIVELNKLRSRACVQPLDKHQNSLDVLTRYYDQLCAIESKLPINPTQNPVSFKWRDAFDKGALFFSRASLTINDSSFERAAVLFNCGALMSEIAASQPIHTDEELKSMAKLFQQSAGVFSKLKDTVLGLVQQDPTPDLMPDTLACLSALMVAQAQEAIYIKAKKDALKPTSLVKLAAQCAEFYQELVKLMSRDTVKGIWDKDWTSVVNGKYLVLSALAQLHGAQCAAEEKHFGEQLSRLQEAQKQMEMANSYINIQSNYQNESATIKKSLELAKKDNDFIYHERVPEFKTLPLLPKASLAKPTPIVSPLSPRFKDMFESLIPVAVQIALSSFESRKNQVINADVGRMREYTQLMNACLASLNLPAALDDVTKYEKCPESIKEKSAKVKASGGLEAIRSKLNELPNLYKRNEEILNETSRLLNDERETDSRLRAQFGAKWTRMASDQLTVPLQQELGKYRGILNTAANADNIVRAKFDENRRGFEMLSMTEVDLTNAIPGVSQQTGQGASGTVSKLRELMNEVQKIKVERENIEKELKKVNCDMANAFMKSMSETSVVNEEKLCTEKLQELFQPLKTRVEQSIKQQENIMNDVQIWNKKFTEEKHASTGASERDEILKQLAKSHDAFFELDNNLKEGTKFYNDLTPLLLRLQQKVSDFCFARQTEKEDLMKQVQQNIVSSGGGESAASKAPPPRPPPPSVQPQQPIPPPIYQNPYQNAPMQQQAPPPGAPQQPYFQPTPYTPYPTQPIYQQYGAQPPYPMQYPGTHPMAPPPQYGQQPPQYGQQQPPYPPPGGAYQQQTQPGYQQQPNTTNPFR